MPIADLRRRRVQAGTEAAERLAAAGLKPSRARVRVLEAVSQAATVLTPDAVFQALGNVCSRGSTYRTMAELHRAGDGVRRDHGWVFEVPAAARRLATPVPLTAMGRFNHEAVTVDPRTGIVYLTEDRDDSLLYRFLPNAKDDLSRGGRLQALALVESGLIDSRNWNGIGLSQGNWQATRWIDLDGVESPGDDLRWRGHAHGALLFARGEGIHFGYGEFYFCCTSGGTARMGQIKRYRPSRF